MKVFSVYDQKVGAFMNPWVARTTGEALRNFTDAVNDPKTPFNAHSEDYTLFCIASWDEMNGRLEPLEAAESVCKAITVKRELEVSEEHLDSVGSVVGRNMAKIAERVQ